jgi:fatty acid desaturase
MQHEYTHKEAIAALDGDELVALKATSDRPGLTHLGLHLAWLAATSTALVMAPNVWILLPALLLHGIALVFLFSLEHECIHGTAFRTPLLNEVLAAAAGFFLILPPRYFRYFHFAHHRHTQDPARDPELAMPRPRNRREYLWQLSGLPFWRSQLSVVMGAALGKAAYDFVPQSGRTSLIVEARCYLAAYGALALISLWQQWTWPLYLWIVPALIGQPFLRAYLLAEHAACPLLPDMLANTRTTFTNRLVNFLAWNMPHHTAHHALPVVPFHQLPRLTARLEQHLKRKADGYVDAHRQIRSAWTGAVTSNAAKTSS